MLDISFLPVESPDEEGSMLLSAGESQDEMCSSRIEFGVEDFDPADPETVRKPSTRYSGGKCGQVTEESLAASVHRALPGGAPRVEVRVNGHPFEAILDSGSTVSLVNPAVLAPRPDSKARLAITCVHGDTQEVAALSAATGAWPIEVGIVKDLPVPVLLGRDWPGFDQLLRTASQPASPSGSRRRPSWPRGGWRRPQVAAGGDFSKAQHEDDRLKHCWAQVQVAEGKEVHPAPHPIPHFVVKNGLLYCVAQRRGEEKILLVVPRTKTETVMELAHFHTMAGHLGAQNTIQRIRDRFHWPGLDAEVRRLCQACPTCQRTSPQTPPPSPLIPLPIIEVPFQWIGMDLVGPLPKSARGHEHILVVVNYATRYPEAIPLRKAKTRPVSFSPRGRDRTRPGQTSVIQHDIRTPSGVIVRQRPYRIPEARRQAVEEEVQEMLKLGVIEPSRRLLPSARSYRFPSLRCPSSGLGWIWWGRCLSLPVVTKTSWWLSTMPPGTPRPFPFAKPPRKPSHMSSSSSAAESASPQRF
ncbi:hypothetical protein QQF64_027036 [Cirrhinus molitorella]|uniref:Gypsy retrotransposon integrase-like protein 1 n=1 Tax=Cirrhinus molitorella TaxID=172907 RepID=A0ABR3NBI9_9TELE